MSGSADSSLPDLPLAARRRLSPKRLTNAVVIGFGGLCAVYGIVATAVETGRALPLWAPAPLSMFLLVAFWQLGLLAQAISRRPLLIIDHDVFWSRSNLLQPMLWSRVARLRWRVGLMQIDGVYLDLRTPLHRSERPAGLVTWLVERLEGRKQIYISFKDLQVNPATLANLMQVMAERQGADVEPVRAAGTAGAILRQFRDRQAQRLAGGS